MLAQRRGVLEDVVRKDHHAAADAVALDDPPGALVNQSGTRAREQALREAADIVGPLERGWLSWEQVWELREVASGARQARTGPQNVTLFKSLGIGLEDVAVGALVYKKAVEQRMGEEVRFLGD